MKHRIWCVFLRKKYGDVVIIVLCSINYSYSMWISRKENCHPSCSDSSMILVFAVQTGCALLSCTFPVPHRSDWPTSIDFYFISLLVVSPLSFRDILSPILLCLFFFWVSMVQNIYCISWFCLSLSSIVFLLLVDCLLSVQSPPLSILIVMLSLWN